MTGIPERSLRRYLERHGTLLPARRQGRTLQVATEALPVLRRMRELYDSGMSAESSGGDTVARTPGRLPWWPTMAGAWPKRRPRPCNAGTIPYLAEPAGARAPAHRGPWSKGARRGEPSRTGSGGHPLGPESGCRRPRSARPRRCAKWLEKRLPEPQAKRMGLVARVKAILWGDRKHGEL